MKIVVLKCMRTYTFLPACLFASSLVKYLFENTVYLLLFVADRIWKFD